MNKLVFDYKVYTHNKLGADPENFDPAAKVAYEERMNLKYASQIELINSYHGIIKATVAPDGRSVIASSLLIDHPIAL